MTINITDRRMTSDQTEHWAVPVTRDQPYDTWFVSWLPGCELSRNQAITAMTIAEAVPMYLTMVRYTAEWGRLDAHIHNWAAELGLTKSEVHAMVWITERVHLQAERATLGDLENWKPTGFINAPARDISVEDVRPPSVDL